ncbi:MAG: hypothetical protein AAF328_09785, partial [Planctomycetota bacterium]
MLLGHPADTKTQSTLAQHVSASLTSIFCRLIWAILAAIHVVPLLLVTARLVCEPSLTTLGSLVALAAVTVFFVAKTADLPLLRSDRPKLELAIWFLAAALVHPAPSDFGHADPLLLTAGATAAVLLVGVRHSRQRTGWKPNASKWWSGLLHKLFGKPSVEAVG